LSTFIRSRLRAVPVLAWMVLIALVLRLALIPFNSFLFEDLMDANHIHAWEQGNVARALRQATASAARLFPPSHRRSLPPVYPLIVAGFFPSFRNSHRLVDLCHSRLRLPD